VPEGDTVFRTAQTLRRALAGATLTASDLRVAALATVDLAGWVVEESVSRGKHLLLRLRPPHGASTAPLTLHSHLGMDGSWRVFTAGRRPAGPAHHIRAVLRTDGAVAVGYQLRELALLPTADEPARLGHLGPDLLEADFDADEAVRRLSRDPDATIADALRDQRNLAGIGNVYCAELLFLRGIWPWTPTAVVGDLPALVALARRVLLANSRRPVRTTTGSLRRGQTAYVYGRRGAPCRRCGTPVAVDDAGERVTYWCPACQPQPAGRAARPGAAAPRTPR
jgi:endonuclease VIII